MVERRTRAKISVVDKKIRELGRLKESLERLVAACEARESTADCPVLEILEHDDAVDIQ